MNQLTYLERVKIQSEILLQLFLDCENNLGMNGLAKLLRSAVCEHAKSLGKAISARIRERLLREAKAGYTLIYCGQCSRYRASIRHR